MIPLVLAAATGAIGLVGWWFWAGDGRLSRGSGEHIRPDHLSLSEEAFGPAGTVLLFGSQQDDRTPIVRERVQALLEGRVGVRIADVDLTARGDLAGRYAVTRTPTVLVLDGERRLRVRVKGLGSEETLRSALDSALAPPAS